MKYFFEHTGELKTECAGKSIFAMFDFDGTLSDIAGSPEEASFPDEEKGMLLKLISLDNVKVAVISGRQLENVKEKTGISGIIYAGSHGLEIEGRGIIFAASVRPEDVRTLEEINNILDERLRGIKGILLEKKRFMTALHYRLADADGVKAAEDALKSIEMVFGKALRIMPGKKVFEIIPASLKWDKGEAVKLIMSLSGMEKENCIPFYAGDDTTDESAFLALRGRGVSVRVGEKEGSAAIFFMKNRKEVADYMKFIYETAKGGL